MQNVFEKINNINIKEALEVAWVNLKKDSSSPYMYSIIKSDWRTDTSFKVHTEKNIAVDFGWDWIKGGTFDIIGRYVLLLDTKENENKKKVIEWFQEKWLIEIETEKKQTVEILKNSDILNKLQNWDLFLWWYKNEISHLLLNRWVDYNYIQKNSLKIWEIFKNIWFADNYFTTEYESCKWENWVWNNKEWDTPRLTSIFTFPCLDEFWKIIWAKLRRKDWKTIRWKKSPSLPAPARTWLLYDRAFLDNKEVVIVEWEMDYIILRTLWYNSVVANLGWVQSNKNMIRDLLYNFKRIIVLYDDDEAWQKAKIELWKALNRPVFEIEFPLKENFKWERIKDVNDLYIAWYNTLDKWEWLFNTAITVSENPKDTHRFPFIFLRKYCEIYDLEFNRFQNDTWICKVIWCKGTDINKYIQDWVIKTYDDLCYLEWWKKGCFNTLKEWSYLKDTWNAIAEIHPLIDYLIKNIWWYKQKNIEYLHKSILYKLTHINDVTIPAVILYWQGWTGKWLWVKLLSQIFGEENTLFGLKQRDLESQFDTYMWWKLIVEFMEVSSWNKFEDKKILDRVKSIVWENKITINAKHQSPKEVDNIARFQLSSNHTIPIQLDSKHSWNRRFTIIKTWMPLDKESWESLATTILTDLKIIKSYVSWLYAKYPEVIELTHFEALNNEEKNNLENQCEWTANLFFEWLEVEYPHITKITVQDKNVLLDKYCNVMWEDRYDIKFKQSNFDNSLSHRYEKKIVSVRNKSQRWYFINKTPRELEFMPEWKNSYFNDNEINNLSLNF